MTDNVIAKAETYDFIINEIYKNLLALHYCGILNANEVDVFNSAIRSRFNDWCLANMDHKEYTKYILRLFEKIKEELKDEQT